MGNVNFTKDIDINIFDLDGECVKNSRLYAQYSEMLVQAEYLKKTLKEREEILHAKLDWEIRNSDNGKKTIREAEIKSEIILNPEIQKILRRLSRADYKVSMLKAALSSIDQKRKHLEYLVRLYCSQYWVTQTKSIERKEEYDEE